MENGKHVLCEKPITASAKEYDALLKLADEKGVIYAEAIMSRHFKGRKILFNALSEIGDISAARIDYCQRSSRYDAFKGGEHMNIFDMSLGAGTLTDLGVYCVYAAVDMFGMPQSINASAAFFDNGADKSGSAILEYDGLYHGAFIQQGGAIGNQVGNYRRRRRRENWLGLAICGYFAC